MRPCKFRIWDRVEKRWNEGAGQWHRWGVNYEELQDGPGNFSVGIVERPDGSVAMPQADEVTFTDKGEP